MLKTALIVVIVVVLGWLVWERHFSRDARIGRMHAECMREFGASADDSTRAPDARAGKDSDPASAIVKGAADAMTSLRQGVGSAVCGMARDACRRDYDGQVCQAALARTGG
jgi:hypothetical protein